MDIWHILVIILFTTQVIASASLCLHGKATKISFWAKVFLGDCLECNFI